MKFQERIARRTRTDGDHRLLRASDALNPVSHPAEPTGRGLVIERLLDALDPVFDGEPPADSYVWGPKGTGKSAVVRGLFSSLDRLIGGTAGRIYTTTRTNPTPNIAFVYVDGRSAKTGFALLHAVLDSLTSEPVPKQGVGAETMQDRLARRLNPSNRHIVVAVDHVGEPETLPIRTVCEQFEPFVSSVSVMAVGREPPTSMATECLSEHQTVECSTYRRHTLIEVLTSRQTNRLLRDAVSHEQLRALADWASGDAHDALAALFSSGLIAEQNSHSRIDQAALDAGMAAVPQPCVSLGRVLALPKSRQQVLSGLIELPETARNSVSTAADGIVDDRIELSRSTIERVLYELAEAGIVRRVKLDDATQVGRPPSRLEPRFPTLVFEQLRSSC